MATGRPEPLPARAGKIAGRPDAAAPGAVAAPQRGSAAATQGAAAVEPRVVIDIDPAVTGGFINGRFDIQIRGRVAATAPIEEVELETDGEVVSRVTYGQPERAYPAVLPDGTPATQRAFVFSLARSQGRAGAPCHCIIRARTPDGFSHGEQYEFAVDPTGPQPVSVTAGPTLSSVVYAGMRAPLVLYVERAMLDNDGNLTIHGWAVSQTQMLTIQVSAGENERLPAAQLGGQRDDVANFYPTYPNARLSGFALTTQLGREARALGQVRAQAITVAGFSNEVVVPLERVVNRATLRAATPPAAEASSASSPVMEPSRTLFAPLRQEPMYQIRADFRISSDPMQGMPVLSPPQPALPQAGAVAAGFEPWALPTTGPERARDPRRNIHFYCDEAKLDDANTLTVVGWAVSAAGIASVTVEVDGEAVGEAELGLTRLDVGEEFASIPMAKLSGFRVQQRIAALPQGEHSVRIVTRNGEGDVREEHKIIVAAGPAPVASSGLPMAMPAGEVTEFRFELDNPHVTDGAVVEPVTGRLTIEGWVLARSGVTGVEIFLNDQRLGEAHYGLARQDVGNAFPDWPNALRSGYAFHCPPRSLRNGDHTVRVVVRSRNGQEFSHRFAMQVRRTEGDDELAGIRRSMSRVEADMLADLLRNLDHHPRFHLVLRATTAIDAEALRRTLLSLSTQVYGDWRLTLLAGDADALVALQDLPAAWSDILEGRIAIVGPDDPACDALLAARSDVSELIGLLCPGDELAVDALAEIALAAGLHPTADVIYADESRHSPATQEREPFFKPDFSPDLLLSTNYIGRPWFVTGTLLHELAVTPRALLRDGEYDLVLRCTDHAGLVHHVARLLAHRGPVVLDDDAASRAALANAAARRGTPADVLDGCLPSIYRLQRTRPATGRVAIIIPTCAAQGHIERCISTLRAKTAYRNYEIVCIDNIPDDQVAWKIWLAQHADRVIDMPGAFNWSRFNNRAAAATQSNYLLFLNDDVEITQEDWLDVLLEHAQRPEVGIVGPQLLYPSGKVQHAGMFLGSSIGRHAFRFAPADEPGYFGLALTQRNVMAVTGACMLMRRSFFDALGGFDEAHSVINNDLDFCLRAHEAGKLTLYTPHASLIHHELASRERLPDVFDTGHFHSRWKTRFAAGDPYFSPRLSRHSDDYRPDDEAVQAVYAAHPLFRADEINRILVVKLDHIGDFVTALPAIRRLKVMFPHASITVLSGRAAHAFADLEPAISEFIEFEFFHARSQLGEKTLTKEDYTALAARLEPYRFDLAVDLRKHLSTRDVLQHTGARFKAGYDYMGQFPFLDIALEWEGDKTLQRKRSHIVDDLLALVETIGTACQTARDLLPTPPMPPAPEMLPEAIRHLFDRPVVVVHAGAGNITKQWPVEYFSALIDLLTERDAVNVLLVGGPDEVELADALLGSLLHPQRVGSVVGTAPLSQLPLLFSAATLYIGNDSGPKHIAGALGVPTIGIHSGVVDAIEWGPVGRRAVALRRNMSCSPCYLAKAEDCPRGLACLRQLDPSLVHHAAEQFLARPVVPRPVTSLVEASQPEIPPPQPPTRQPPVREPPPHETPVPGEPPIREPPPGPEIPPREAPPAPPPLEVGAVDAAAKTSDSRTSGKHARGKKPAAQPPNKAAARAKSRRRQAAPA